LDLLLKGWEEKVKELGALIRAREIKTAGELLRLILRYLTKGAFFAGALAVIRLAGQCHLNKNATYKRIGNSAEWLQWLVVNLWRAAGGKPTWLGDKAVCLVDGSEVVYGGAAKIQSNLHYGVDAYTLGMKELHLTNRGGGEKLSRSEQLVPNDVEVGDWIYGTILGPVHTCVWIPENESF
jgi:hypothetical protein